MTKQALPGWMCTWKAEQETQQLETVDWIQSASNEHWQTGAKNLWTFPSNCKMKENA